MFITQNNQGNSYLHPNTNITIQDNTVFVASGETNLELPKFNMLIPICVDRGITDTLEIFYPGQADKFLLVHGNPNPQKYGFGPNMIYDVLASGANVGIYTINLRSKDATKSNVILSMKYKIEKDVPYTDAEGNPYYIAIDESGNRILTTDPGIMGENEAVVRDVMHVKFVTSYVEDCRDWTDVHEAMNNISDVEDENGYITLPWFSVMYRGSGKYGNNIYWGLSPRISEADKNTYFAFNMFDGSSSIVTDSLVSMDPSAGNRYGVDYYIETLFNSNFQTMRFMSSEVSDRILELFQNYLYTADDIINGNEPSIKFSTINPFNLNEFGIVIDDGSINIEDTKAIQLYGGSDGDIDRDSLYKAFFNSEVISDITSPLRYRFSYVPDIGYDAETKKVLLDFLGKRSRMTNATLMVGSNSTFESGIIEKQGEFYADMPYLRLISKAQSPMKTDQFTHKTIRFPASYYDTIALVEHIKRYGHPYNPFAGYNARWRGYIEDTMKYPPEDQTFVNKFSNARVNLIMKDSADGGYISEQNMNISFESDQLEFNNACLVADMIYDTVQLIHKNHFSLNEADDVQLLKETINEYINGTYSVYSASLSINVYRQGTIGRAKNTNVIEIIINLRDINKYAQVNLVLTN